MNLFAGLSYLFVLRSRKIKSNMATKNEKKRMRLSWLCVSDNYIIIWTWKFRFTCSFCKLFKIWSTISIIRVHQERTKFSMLRGKTKHTKFCYCIIYLFSFYFCFCKTCQNYFFYYLKIIWRDELTNTIVIKGISMKLHK